MSGNHVIFVKDAAVDPNTLPIIEDDAGFFDVIKKAVLDEYTPLIWSSKVKRWVYILYNDQEVKKIKKQHRDIDCITLEEMWRLKGIEISSETWVRIFDAKKVFNVTIRGIK